MIKQKEGSIFKIERYRLDDGPGIRTTVFLKGCPLRCYWCSNPESQNIYPEIMYNKSLCIKECNECIKACLSSALKKDEEGKVRIDRQLCKRCNKCADVCCTKALINVGKNITAEEVLREIKKDIPFYKATGGGVTISGGEPLFQLEFTQEILKGCKEKWGLHTVLDTSGYGNLGEILNYTDLVLYDIKLIDSVTHKEYTGKSNEIILKNLEEISKKSIPMIVRIPVIPGINDSEKNIVEVVEILKGLQFMHVELLPYHRLGVNKYKMLGREYKLKSTKQPTKTSLNIIRNLFISNNIECKIVI
ncbi:MAG TPA: glycyl-radical enzyme activating protein [Candidatus Atribacteria bacterium]|nr:glycyl-radical enzyme activating protein [Candidatus Atribacteria bacterium]